MMISRFFFPSPLPGTPGGPEAQDCVALPDSVAHHATRVLRLRDGDAVVLFDGSGHEVAGRLQARGRAWFATLETGGEITRESPLHVVLVQALASGDKMDWIVQKAVELGVAGVIPVAAERSVLRLSGERAEKRVAHWRQVAVSACEQSGRNRVPQVAPIVDLGAYLAQHASAQRWILAPAEGRRLADGGAPAGALHVLVGPEGGWSDAELASCLRAGCVAATLGPRVLRTETAGLAALAALQALWGDF